jgi:RNA polymerase sigma-70 factor (ECF subfamily)
MDEDFQKLLQEVQDGSPAATRLLIDQYGPHVIRAVRRALHQSIRSKFDSIDFVQAVWASFLVVFEEIGKFERAEHLIAYLATMARNKVLDEVRRRTRTEKYNVKRERSLAGSSISTGRFLSNKQPSPSQVAVVNELWERMLAGQPEPYQRILELRRDGQTHDQIAKQLGINERTVRRVIDKIGRRWAQ